MAVLGLLTAAPTAATASLSSPATARAAAPAGGQVWAWGYGGEGELGDGTLVSRPTPRPVPGMTGVVKVAAGLDFSLALRADGTVWSWGTNEDGEIGDGTTVRRRTRPVQVVGLSGRVFWLRSGDGCCFGYGRRYGSLVNQRTNTNLTKVTYSINGGATGDYHLPSTVKSFLQGWDLTAGSSFSTIGSESVPARSPATELGNVTVHHQGTTPRQRRSTAGWTSWTS